MKTVSEHIRERLLRDVERRIMPDLDSLSETEWSPKFERLMRNRLILGAMRYGLIHEPGKPQWDRVGRAQAELAFYERDKSQERLVDIANMMLLEFEEGGGVLTTTDEGGIHTQIKKG